MALPLKVVSTPQQPTLNPKIVTNPVQPKLAPKMVSKPVQPVLAPKVVTNPVQPNFSPVAASQPANLPQINVDNSPRFVPLGEQVKLKYPGAYDDMDSGELGKTVAVKYPGIYDQFITPGIAPETKPEGVRGLKGAGLGLLKEAGQRVVGGASLAQKALELIPGSKATATLKDVFGEKLEQKGTAEKIGGAIENVAEFFIPGGAVSKVGKAIETGVKSLNYGSKATKALQLAGKVGLGAVESAGITAVQGGSNSDIKLAAGLGAGFSVVAKGIESVLKRVPETAWSSILKRTPTEAAKNPNLTRQAAETGLTGLTRQSIANKAQTAIQSIEVTLDDLLSNSKGKINTAKIAGYLADLRNSYAVIPGEKSSVRAIDEIASELYDSFKTGQAMTLVEANQLKRNIYQVIAKSYGKGMLELPAKTEAQKLVAAGLKREIEKVIPEVKNLNEKQAIYIQIKKALDKTIARTEGKGIAGTGVGLYDLLIGGIGSGAGAIAGTPLLGLGLVVTKKTAESPLVLSSTAKLLGYFDTLSPTKKLLFYQAVKGFTIESGTSINSAFQKKAR